MRGYCPHGNVKIESAEPQAIVDSPQGALAL